MSRFLVFVVAFSFGCGEPEAEAVPQRPAAESASQDEPEEQPEAEAGWLSGMAEGEPFVARGVLTRRMPNESIEIRVFSRAVSCDNFRSDYEVAEDEKVITVFIRWPKTAGEEISLGASNTADRMQFCHGRPSGHAVCAPRAPEQGSLTVLEATPESGALSLDVSSPAGNLSGRLDFTICP